MLIRSVIGASMIAGSMLDARCYRRNRGRRSAELQRRGPRRRHVRR